MTILEKKLNLNIDVNIFEIMQKAYEEYFNRRKNKLGCSEIPFGAKKIIISRLFNIPFENNMKMLHGKIHHGVLQQPEILRQIIETICKQLGITEPVKVIVEKEVSYEVLEGKILEGHIDVSTSAFIIEIKTTSVPLKFWSKELAPFHYIQTNTYLGIEKQEFGFIIYINLKAFESKITDFDEVWKKYGCFIPVVFDKEIFDLTLEKAKRIFELMEVGRWDLECPEYEWECKTCPKEIQAICQGKNDSNQVFITES